MRTKNKVQKNVRLPREIVDLACKKHLKMQLLAELSLKEWLCVKFDIMGFRTHYRNPLAYSFYLPAYLVRKCQEYLDEPGHENLTMTDILSGSIAHRLQKLYPQDFSY